MAFSDNKVTGFTFNHKDQADELYLNKSSEEIKADFDSRAEQLQTALSGLIDALESSAPNNSGAQFLGVQPIEGLNGSKLRDILVSLKQAIDATIVGQIADNSITNAKLVTDIKIGSLGALTTVDHSALVNAINELKALITSNTTDIGTKVPQGDRIANALPADPLNQGKLLNLNQFGKFSVSISGDADTVDGKHALQPLTTIEQADLAKAINELNANKVDATGGTLSADLILPNNKAFYVKDSTGANKLIAKINPDNSLTVGDTTIPLMLGANQAPIWFNGTSYFAFLTANGGVLNNASIIQGKDSSGNVKNLLYLANTNYAYLGDASVPFIWRASGIPLISDGTTSVQVLTLGGQDRTGATNITGNFKFNSGKGIYLYSDAGTTQQMFLDGTNGMVNANRITLNQANTGIAPMTVTSTTKVTNLQADSVDGYHFNQGVQTTDSPSFVAVLTDRLNGKTTTDKFNVGSGAYRFDLSATGWRMYTKASGSADHGIRINDGGSIDFLLNNVQQFSVALNGVKTGGTYELDGITYGMSPVDSPRVLIEDLYIDQQVEEAGTTISIDPLLARMLSKYAVFPNNPQARVTAKNADSFVISGYTGTIDISLKGYRNDSQDQYFPIMNNMLP